MLTDQQHPITPPPELVEQWYDAIDNSSTSWKQELATQAARWSANRELDECVEWMRSHFHGVPQWADQLRAARRPQPPSLAEQALEEIQQMEGAMYSADLGCDFTATRAALERLQQLEQENND